MVTKACPLVILLGRNYGNIITMARDLGVTGYEVKILRLYKKKPSLINLLSKMEPDRKSKYVKDFRRCIVNDKSENVISELINMADENTKALVIPTDDYSASLVDDNMNILKEYFIIPNINEKQGEISRLMNKHIQKELAGKFNLKLLSGCEIKSVGGKFNIPDDIKYPCFIKPNVSMKSKKSMMCKVDDASTLNALLSKYAKSGDFDMLVEEYADVKQEYSILGVCAGGKVVAPGIFKTIKGGNRERKGVALTGEVIPCSEFQSVIHECNEFIKSLNYTGIFDVDLVETEDGNIYFIELNFRCGASSHALTELGANLPKIYADFSLMDVEIDEHCMVESYGKRFVSEKLLLEEYARCDISFKEVKKNMREADIYFIMDENDMGPYRNFKKFYFVAWYSKLPYMIRDKMRNK